MGLKSYLFLFFASFFLLSNAQNRLDVGIVLDNDLYVSTVNDKYYTNGFEIYIRKLNTKKAEKIHKSIDEFLLSQKIYNPFAIRVNIIERTDRPFAGYLYASIGKITFYKNESVLKKSIQFGYVGPNAFGQEVQELFHNTFGYKKVIGWENQIKNTLALQVHLMFSKKLHGFSQSKKIDVQWVSDINFGTILNGVTTGPLLRFSFENSLKPITHSVLFDGALAEENETDDKKERFVFLQPQVNAQLYDATIQGSMFQNNSPVVRDITHFRYGATAGFQYRKKQMYFSYSIIYRSKEVDFPDNEGHYYGSVSIGYLL